jgi:hypothetical protein
VLERGKLASALAQGGLEPGDRAQRLVDDHQIEKLVSRTGRLTALTQTILECGSGYTHGECSELRLPYPASLLRAVPENACRCRGFPATASHGMSDDS